MKQKQKASPAVKKIVSRFALFVCVLTIVFIILVLVVPQPNNNVAMIFAHFIILVVASVFAVLRIKKVKSKNATALPPETASVEISQATNRQPEPDDFSDETTTLEEDVFYHYGNTDSALLTVDLMEGHEFEYWCGDLLQRNGYVNVEVTAGSGDQGGDVLAEKDGIKYAIQCKCYSRDLGNAPVQEVNAGNAIYHRHIGVVMTNRYFTQGAKEAADATGVLLWDRDVLRKMIRASGVESREINS